MPCIYTKRNSLKNIFISDEPCLRDKFCQNTAKFVTKGSRRNKFTFSEVETPAWQGAGRANNRLFNRRATQPDGMGALKCEVIFERALSTSSAFLLFFFDSQLINTVTYRPKADTEQFGGFLLFPLANFKGLVNMYSFDVRQDIIQGNTIFHLVQVNI